MPSGTALSASGSEGTSTPSMKESYLRLLPHHTLVNLVLALDRDPNASIWPADLASAVKALHEYPGSVIAPFHPPPVAPAIPAGLPPSAKAPRQSTPLPLPKPNASYSSSPPLPPHVNPQQYAMVGYVSQAARNAKGRPPSGPGSGGMPSYEEMIVATLHDLNEPDGVQPKVIFDYMSAHWPLIGNFRPSASQALGKAFTRGRLQKVANKYRINPDWEGGPTSKRTTRRPQNQKNVAPHQPPLGTPAYGWHPPGAMPYPMVYGAPPGSSVVAPNPYQAVPRAAARQDSGDEDELDEDVDVGGTEMDQPYDHENEVDELEDETHSKPTPLPSLRDSLRKLAHLLTDTLSEPQWSPTDTKSVAIRT